MTHKPTERDIEAVKDALKSAKTKEDKSHIEAILKMWEVPADA